MNLRTVKILIATGIISGINFINAATKLEIINGTAFTLGFGDNPNILDVGGSTSEIVLNAPVILDGKIISNNTQKYTSLNESLLC